MTKHVAFALLIILISVDTLKAQWFSAFNGRNHPEIEWVTVETEHFRITYPAHLDNIQLAEKAAAIAEASYDALSKNLNVTFDHKIKIFLSDEDEISNGFAVPFTKEYTNIWVNVNDYATIWTGDVKWLRKVIAHELTHIFQFQAIESNIGIYQNLFAQTMRRDITEGLAQYETELWDSQRGDRWLRLAVFDNNMNYSDGNSIYNGRLIYAVGNSQVRYFADQFGDSTLANLFAYKDTLLRFIYVHDFYKAFEQSIGMKYEEFYDKWLKDVNIYYNSLAAKMDRIDELGKPLDLPGQFIIDARYDPKGERLAFLSYQSTERPVVQLRLADSLNGKSRVLTEGNFTSSPSWSDDGTKLTYSRIRRGKNSSLVNDLFIYDLDKNSEKKVTFGEKSAFPIFSGNGTQLIAIKNDNGTANIVVYNLNGEFIKQVTHFSGDVQLIGLNRAIGSQMIYTKRFDENGNRELLEIDDNSRSIRVLDSGDLDNRFVEVSPDRTKIAYTSLRDDVPNVFLRDIESGEEIRITNQFTGAALLNWTASDSLNPNGRLILSASENKNSSKVYAISADSLINNETDSLHIPANYISWTKQRPPNEIPFHINPNASLITSKSRYSSLKNLTDIGSMLLPVADNRDYGLIFFTGIFDPLAKDMLFGNGYISLKDPAKRSEFGVTYMNNHFFPTYMVNLFRIPTLYQFYGSEVQSTYQTGVSLNANIPIDWPYHDFHSTSIQTELRYFHAEPYNFMGSSLNIDTNNLTIPPPQEAYQSDMTVSFMWKKQKPYRWNVIHPLDGSGVRAKITFAEKLLGSDVSFVRGEIKAFHILPLLGQLNLYVYGKGQIESGSPLPQDYIGLSRYDNIEIGLPADVENLLGDYPERVRGYHTFISGSKVAFGSAELRIPLLPSLYTTLLGIISLEKTTFNLFVDAAYVGDTNFGWPDQDVTQSGAGFEVKNALSLFGFPIAQSLGVGYPTSHLFDDSRADWYYRVKAVIPF